MSKMEPKVKEILAKYHDNPEDAVWFHKQSGQWLAKHKALEAIAIRAGIEFNLPTVLQFDLEKKIAAFIVCGVMGDKDAWSVGEATSYNSQNQYYGAMAEKRGKDRVILKLIGLHGDVYSDDEIEAKESKKETDKPKVITQEQKLEAANKKAQVIIAEYKMCKDLGMLADVQEKYHSELKRFSEGYDDIFSQINTVGLQVIASFDQ